LQAARARGILAFLRFASPRGPLSAFLRRTIMSDHQTPDAADDESTGATRPDTLAAESGGASDTSAEAGRTSVADAAPPSANGKVPGDALANRVFGERESGAAEHAGGGSGGASDSGGEDDGGQPDGDGEPAPRQRREAIIYFPGLRRDGVESIEAVAHRVALAMDNNHPDASYSAATGETAVFAEHRAAKATVARKTRDGKPATVLDIYEMDYRGPLVDSFGKRSALYQGWQVFATMAGNTRNFIAAVKRPGQSIPQKLQVLYGGMLLSTMLLYIAFLLLTAAVTANQGVIRFVREDSAAVAAPARTAANPPAGPAATARARPAARTAAAQTVGPVSQPAAQPKPTEGARSVARANGKIAAFFAPVVNGIRWVGEVVWALLAPIGLAFGAGARVTAGWLREMWDAANANAAHLQAAVASITVVGLGFRFNLKDTLARTSGTTACVGSYLAYGKGRHEIVGMMARLLEHLRADEKVEYTRIHVVGYSFGSVVAIDCVYQDSEMSAAFDAVTTLTTIGCPADFIRTYWRDYFVSRHGTAHGVRWLNVYSPGDVLASNFMDGKTCGIGAHRDFMSARDRARVNGISLCPRTASRLHVTDAGEVDDATPDEADAGAGDRAEARAGGEPEALAPHQPDELSVHPQTVVKSAPAARSADAKASGAARDPEVHVIPNAHVVFGHRAPKGFGGWMLFILAGNGFKAHRCYWADGISNAKTCWEPLVARVCNPAAVPHPPIQHPERASTDATSAPAAKRETAAAAAG
jgi:hypothetical protein